MKSLYYPLLKRSVPLGPGRVCQTSFDLLESSLALMKAVCQSHMLSCDKPLYCLPKFNSIQERHFCWHQYSAITVKLKYVCQNGKTNNNIMTGNIDRTDPNCLYSFFTYHFVIETALKYIVLTYKEKSNVIVVNSFLKPAYQILLYEHIYFDAVNSLKISPHL